VRQHDADAAISEIPVQKTPCPCVENLPVWHVNELRMIEAFLTSPRNSRSMRRTRMVQFPGLPEQVTLVHATVQPNLPTGAGIHGDPADRRHSGSPGIPVSRSPSTPSTSSLFLQKPDKPDKSHVIR
jgi:hypothetical protein